MVGTDTQSGYLARCVATEEEAICLSHDGDSGCLNCILERERREAGEMTSHDQDREVTPTSQHTTAQAQPHQDCSSHVGLSWARPKLIPSESPGQCSDQSPVCGSAAHQQAECCCLSGGDCAYPHSHPVCVRRGNRTGSHQLPILRPSCNFPLSQLN